MAKEQRFYVYEIFKDAELLYIGKGSGRRLQTQKKNFNADGRVIEWFFSEEKAYSFEKKQIAQKSPPLNRHKGGNGSKAQKIKREVKPLWFKEIESLGSRKYAARLWLKFAPLNMRSSSIVESIRGVAYG